MVRTTSQAGWVRRHQQTLTMPSLTALLVFVLCGDLRFSVVPNFGSSLLSPVAAVEVPGWKRDPIPGQAPGTADSLMAVYEDVLSDSMLAALRDEAPIMAEFAKTFGNLNHNKYVTFWMPMGPDAREPRTASEYAVKVMFDILFGDKVHPMDKHRRAMRKKVVGGKYWYQYRGPSDSVNFHYDKDEGMASDQMIMRFPMYSTVTYIEPHGAPTVVFNQTIIHNGNVEVPPIPEATWLVFPKLNKMMVQRGDLNHGADDSLSALPLRADEHRVTFVISWEDVKPLEPNCHEIAEDEIPEGLLREMSPTWQLNDKIHRIQPQDLTPRHGDSEAHWRTISMGRDGAFVKALIPEPTNRQAVPDPHGSYLLRWSDKQVFGQAYELNLHSPMQNRILFNGRTPAAIVFSDARSRKYAHRAFLRAAKEWFKKYPVESMNFFFADAIEDAAALEHFKIRRRNLPTAVVHHTHRNPQTIFRMNQRVRSPSGKPDFSARRILRFLSKVQKGKVRSLGNNRWEEL